MTKARAISQGFGKLLGSMHWSKVDQEGANQAYEDHLKEGCIVCQMVFRSVLRSERNP